MEAWRKKRFHSVQAGDLAKLARRRIHDDNCKAAVMRWQLFQTARLQSRMLRADRRAYAHGVSVRAQSAAEKNDTKTLYACVRTLQPFRKKPFTAMQLEDGTLAQTPVQCRGRWQQHFSNLLHGRDTELAELADAAWKARDSVERQTAINQMPTFDEIVERFAAAPAGKATGEDCLPGELFKAASKTLATVTYPHVQEDLWMGASAAAMERWRLAGTAEGGRALCTVQIIQRSAARGLHVQGAVKVLSSKAATVRGPGGAGHAVWRSSRTLHRLLLPTVTDGAGVGRAQKKAGRDHQL